LVVAFISSARVRGRRNAGRNPIFGLFYRISVTTGHASKLQPAPSSRLRPSWPVYIIAAVRNPPPHRRRRPITIWRWAY